MEPPSPVRFNEFDLCLIYDSLGQGTSDNKLTLRVGDALTLITNYRHTPHPEVTRSFSTPKRDELVRSLDKLIRAEAYFTAGPQYRRCLALRERLALN